jgi:hypothetical protein
MLLPKPDAKVHVYALEDASDMEAGVEYRDSVCSVTSLCECVHRCTLVKMPECIYRIGPVDKLTEGMVYSIIAKPEFLAARRHIVVGDRNG